MRRLVVLSALLILGGLALLLPSSSLYNLITTGSTSAASSVSFGVSRASTTTGDTTTIESLLGFGMIGVGLAMEILSLFTDVGETVPSMADSSAEKMGAKQQ